MSAVSTKDLQQLILSAIAAQAPATDIVPVVLDQAIAAPCRSIRCTGNAGTLRVTTAAGNVRNTSIAAGQILPLSATKIATDGTTATGLEWLL